MSHSWETQATRAWSPARICKSPARIQCQHLSQQPTEMPSAPNSSAPPTSSFTVIFVFGFLTPESHAHSEAREHPPLPSLPLGPTSSDVPASLRSHTVFADCMSSTLHVTSPGLTVLSESGHSTVPELSGRWLSCHPCPPGILTSHQRGEQRPSPTACHAKPAPTPGPTPPAPGGFRPGTG